MVMSMKNIIIILAGIVLLLGVSVFVLVNNPTTQRTTDTMTTSTPGQTSGETINLSNRSLQTISQDIFNSTGTTTLDVSHNRLTGALPSELRKLTNLEVLLASDNAMTSIPAEIGQLSKLRIANFANNNLSGLPLEIGNLTQLETLDLRGNPNLSQHDLGLIRAKIPKTTILTD